MNQYSEISFPVYRRYRNGMSWFRIDSPDSFEEIRVVGSQYLLSQHDVKILPDRNLVYDLVFAYQEFAEEVSPEAYAVVRGKTV